MTQERMCPICYLPMPSAGSKCPMCGTCIGENGVLLPEPGREMPPPPVDSLSKEEIEEMKPVLEEFMAIPGMTPEGAYKMYRAGYRSLAEVVKGAFHNDDEYATTSRLLANRILASSMETEEEVRKVPCPYCKSPVSPDETTCPVCGEGLNVGIADLDSDLVEMNVESFAGNLLDKLQNDPDFGEMPEELRSQILDVVGEDLDVDFTPGEEEMTVERGAEKTEEPLTEDPRKKRYREKLRAWKEKGVDPFIIEELEELLDSDFERFKTESVKILRQRVKEMRERKKAES